MTITSPNGTLVVNQVLVGTSATLLVAATPDVQAGRRELTVMNPGNSEVNLGDATVVPGGGLPIPPNYGSITIDPENACKGAWYAASGSAGYRVVVIEKY